MTALSNDRIDRWRVGDAAPEGLTLDPLEPPEEQSRFELTITGSGAAEEAPVTLRDLTLGRQTRVVSESDGSFEITLEVSPRSKLLLLRNQDTLAYVASLGLGVQVVDVNAFWNETNNPILSEVIGIYSGFGDPDLELCGDQVSDIGGALIDLEGVFDGENAHPLSLAGLASFRGLLMLEDMASAANSEVPES